MFVIYCKRHVRSYSLLPFLSLFECKGDGRSSYAGDFGHVNYGSIIVQIKEVNRESKGCCEFLSKSYRILHGTSKFHEKSA